MTKQPEALRLAEWLETSPYHHDKVTVATELRRLHEVNADLLEALKGIDAFCDEDMQHRVQTSREYDIKTLAQAAISKAEVKHD